MTKDINFSKNGNKSQRLLQKGIKILLEQDYKHNKLKNKFRKINKLMILDYNV